MSHFNLKKTMLAHRSQMPRTNGLVDSKQKAHEVNEIVLDEGLVEESVEHTRREHIATGEGHAEHVGNVRASLTLTFLERSLENHAYSVSLNVVCVPDS